MNMTKRTLIQLLRRYFVFIIIFINISFALSLGFIVRDNQIKNEKNNISTNIKETANRIYSKINSDYEKIKFLSDILSSQLTSNRIYYQYNSLFSKTLSSDEALNRIFIVFSKYAKIRDPELMSFRDSVGRLNVSWYKSYKGIVNIDTINTFKNSQKYDFVKSTGVITVFNATEASSQTGKNVIKTIVFPIYEGANFIGVIGYSVNSSYIDNILSTNNLQNYCFVTDEDGILLFDRNKQINKGKPFTAITNFYFRKYEQDIIHNNNLSVFSKNHFLFLYPLNLDFYNKYWKIGVILPTGRIVNKANWFLFLFLLSFILLSIVEIYIFNKIVIRSSSFIEKMNSKIRKLSVGEFDDKIEEVFKFEEINMLSRNLEELRLRFIELTDIHYQIQQQVLTKKMKSKGDSDQLASSINLVIDSIKRNTLVRRKEYEIKQKNDWINEGINKINEASKIKDNSIENLADKINEKIAVFTDAFLSSIFINVEEPDTKQKYLEAVSTFGLKKKRAFKKKILFGEGIVGTVAKERKAQYFDKIPENYSVIVGGLEEMKPKSILVQPLEYEGEFFGILEIAFLKKLQDFELRFFQLVSSEIALSIRNIMNNIYRNSLLEKMKAQTIEIEKSKKLLEKKINELRIKEAESEKNQVELQAMYNAVNNTLMTIEYSTTGILITANQKYLKTMNYSLSELKGVNVLDLVKSERAELSEVIKKVAAGEHYEKIMKRFTKYGEVKWLYSSYTPYYDSSGKITKVLYFAFDVTKTKNFNVKLEKEVSLLKKQIKILREKL